MRATRVFGENEALGLSLEASKTVLLFSKRYQTNKHEKYRKSGYEVKGAEVEYKVYWYDKEEDKDYLIVLPRVVYGLEQSG
jgi:ATP-dependent DNA helicase RecQ